MIDELLLVDKNDNVVGKAEKLHAHQEGLLHRALSVFVFNSRGEMLIHQRASHKYHSPELWSNACCSHPRPSESSIDAAHRRLKEEVGLVADLTWIFNFYYHVAFDNGLVEHELDHIFIAITDEKPILNPDEVMAVKYVEIESLIKDVEQQPEAYTYWFKELLEKVLYHYNSLVK